VIPPGKSPSSESVEEPVSVIALDNARPLIHVGRNAGNSLTLCTGAGRLDACIITHGYGATPFKSAFPFINRAR